MKIFLVAYDIFNQKRLKKVKKIVYSFSTDGQKSAREVYLDKRLMQNLISQLLEVLDDNDKVNIIEVKSKPILLTQNKFLEFKNEGMVIL
jgi:CRISPR-associated endonuclease Cas2